MEHEISVATLQRLLAQLRPDDILIPNEVANLKIVRRGEYAGYVDLLKDHCAIELFKGRPAGESDPTPSADVETETER